MSLKFCFVTTRVFESLSMLAASYVAYQHRAAPHRVPPGTNIVAVHFDFGFCHDTGNT